jgi:lambda repressor-like predicted transcriptional regulator
VSQRATTGSTGAAYGWSQQRIARQYGCSPATVASALRQVGLPTDLRAPPPDIDPTALAALRTRGWSQKRIAIHYGCHHQSVARAVARQGDGTTSPPAAWDRVRVPSALTL